MERETLLTASRLGLIDEDALQQQIMEKYRQMEKRRHRYKITRMA